MLALEIIADFGVDSITCHVGNTPAQFAEYSLEHLHECILRSLDELLPVAERLGITIAIENIWFATNTPEKLLDIAEHFQSDNLGFCYDSGHANLMTKPSDIENSHPKQAWERFGPVPYDSQILEKMLPHITTCHLHDNNGAHDQHLLPGLGTIDWDHVIGLLRTAPRLKCFQNEVIPVRTGASIADVCRVFSELLG
jgi:sugar phosphate isomerase/epimerase